jgi:hypothetical protein
MMGLISFMLSDETSVGAINSSKAECKKFAKDSLNWNIKTNKTGRFEKIFETHYVRLGLREGKIEELPKKNK